MSMAGKLITIRQAYYYRIENWPELIKDPRANQTSQSRSWQAGWFRGSRHIVARQTELFSDAPTPSGPGNMCLCPSTSSHTYMPKGY